MLDFIEKLDDENIFKQEYKKEELEKYFNTFEIKSLIVNNIIEKIVKIAKLVL